MRSIDFYEFVGVIVPGAVLLAGIGLLLDAGTVNRFLSPEGIGNAVVYLVLAYVVGHLIAAIGNWLEVLFWKPWRGMPTDWPLTRPALSEASSWKTVVESYCGEKCKANDFPKWKSLVAKVRSKVYASNMAMRLNVFNGNYGMFRGLIVSEFAIALVAWKSNYNLGLVYAVLGVASILTFYRMYHFGILYARELFSNVANLSRNQDN